MTVVFGTNTSASRRHWAKHIGPLLLVCAGAIGLAACGGSTGATSGQGTTTSVVHNTVVTPPKGESAVKVPPHITYGTGSIGAADPTTTLPSELGQAIQPGLNPGQNMIIKGGRVLPQTLESAAANTRRLVQPVGEAAANRLRRCQTIGGLRHHPSGWHVHLDTPSRRAHQLHLGTVGIRGQGLREPSRLI